MVRIKPSKDYLVALESVAMTDIVMNMFIFFFISFSLLYTFNPARISRIDVKLPKATSAVSLEGSEKIVVSITKDGEYFVGDEKTAPSGLKGVLARLKDEDAARPVLLKVDKAARFDKVTVALDAVNALGMEKVSVAVEEGSL